MIDYAKQLAICDKCRATRKYRLRNGDELPSWLRDRKCAPGWVVEWHPDGRVDICPKCAKGGDRSALYEALHWAGFEVRDVPGSTVGGKSALRRKQPAREWVRGTEIVEEHIGPGSFLMFEHYALYATSDAYRSKTDAQIQAELDQGMGCYLCPATDRHVDGVCIEDGCNCPSRNMLPKLESKR